VHRPLSYAQVAAHFATLGVQLNPYFRGLTSAQEAVAACERAKTDAKAAFKRLAFDAHPDRGGDVEAFKALTAAWSAIEKLTPALPKPQPVAQHTVVQYRVVPVRWNTYSGTASTYTGGWF